MAATTSPFTESRHNCGGEILRLTFGTALLQSVASHEKLGSATSSEAQHGGKPNNPSILPHLSILYIIIYPLYYCGTHLSLYPNISMCDIVLKDLLKRI
jgi:hypothetical protein